MLLSQEKQRKAINKIHAYNKNLNNFFIIRKSIITSAIPAIIIYNGFDKIELIKFSNINLIIIIY